MVRVHFYDGTVARIATKPDAMRWVIEREGNDEQLLEWLRDRSLDENLDRWLLAYSPTQADACAGHALDLFEGRVVYRGDRTQPSDQMTMRPHMDGPSQR